MLPTAFIFIAVVWMGVTGVFLGFIAFTLVDIRNALERKIHS